MSAGKTRGIAGFHPQGCVNFLVRRHPVKTAQAVETVCGVPARTVERWIAGDSKPSVGAFGLLVAGYGPAFLAAAVPGLAWVERAAAYADHEVVTAQIEVLRRRQAGLLAAMVPGERP